MKNTLLILFFCVFGTYLHAATTSHSSTVAAINTVAISNQLSDAFVGSNGLTDVAFFNYTVNNNDIDGYNLTIASTNSGQMRLSSGYSASKNGTFFDYTIDHVLDGSRASESCTGTPGGTIAHNGNEYIADGDLESNITVNYTAPNEASVNCQFQITLTAASDSTVFSGDMSDTITLSIANR